MPLEILEFVPSAICILDENFRVEWVNAAYCEFAPRKSLIGRTWDEIWGETGQRFDTICRRVLETGTPHVVTDEGNTIRRGPDEPLTQAYFSWSLHRVRLPGSSHWNLLGTAEETTARVEATLAAREGEQAYRALFQSNPHPMWVYDKHSLAFLEVNDAAVEQYGFSQAEFLQMTLADIRPPEDVEAMLSSAYAEMDTVITPARMWRHCTKQGTVLDVEISSHSIQYRGHDARLVLAHNVTQRVQAEKRLRESEALHRMTIDHAAVGIAHVTPDGRFAKVNAKLCEIFGYTEPDLLACTFQEITYPEDLEIDLTLLRRVLAGLQTHYTLEKRYVRKDGTIVPALLTVSLVRESDGSPWRFISIVEDISARRAAEAERERLQEQLVQAQKLESVGRLAGGVAHDFNNMLNVILGYTDMAMEEVQPETKLAADLREISDAAHRSAGITAQLLAFARKQPVLPRRMELNVAVEGSLKMLRRLVGEELTLSWLPGDDLWSIQMDPVQLDQVLANLVLNARDAVHGNGTVTIQTSNREVTPQAAAELGLAAGEYVELVVHDDGAGIPPEVLPHLFEPFFTTKELGRGTGLGLATVFGIVSQHRGHVRAASPPGQGATLTVTFPRTAEEGPSAEARREIASLPRGSETVLVVEDEPALLRLACGLLSKLGYHVLAAELPSVAIRLAYESTAPIDLVLSDVMMPEQRGPTLARTLLRRWPDARVLFMSGYAGPLVEEAPEGLDVSKIIAKPFTVNTLAQRVRAALDAPA